MHIHGFVVLLKSQDEAPSPTPSAEEQSRTLRECDFFLEGEAAQPPQKREYLHLVLLAHKQQRCSLIYAVYICACVIRVF